ncbi:Uncharacterised protein [Vibrio cholerae]|nr:Uncharacterised protein [Vibrio cholerae]
MGQPKCSRPPRQPPSLRVDLLADKLRFDLPRRYAQRCLWTRVELVDRYQSRSLLRHQA